MTYHYELKRAGSGAYTEGVAGENLADRDLVYLNASGLWVKADSDSAISMPVIGLTMGALTSGKRGSFLLRGFIGLASWSWTSGGAIYPTSVSGVISQTAPTTGLRQTLGYAVTSSLIYFDRGQTENLIYWSSTIRSNTNPTTGARVTERLVCNNWWVIEIIPGETIEDNFNGVFDITSLGIASIISNYAYYAVKTGAGTITANSGPSTGMRLTTGATTNDDILIATGDNTGFSLTWNPTYTPWMHLHYRFPNAADAANSYFLGAFYQDANNYVGIRYDTAVDTNLRFVTRSGGLETLTVLGALDTDWHDIYVKFNSTEVLLCQEGNATVSHITNIPSGNFTWYTYLKTLANAAKNYDVAHLIITQSDT